LLELMVQEKRRSRCIPKNEEVGGREMESCENVRGAFYQRRARGGDGVAKIGKVGARKVWELVETMSRGGEPEGRPVVEKSGSTKTSYRKNERKVQPSGRQKRETQTGNNSHLGSLEEPERTFSMSSLGRYGRPNLHIWKLIVSVITQGKTFWRRGRPGSEEREKFLLQVENKRMKILELMLLEKLLQCLKKKRNYLPYLGGIRKNGRMQYSAW